MKNFPFDETARALNGRLHKTRRPLKFGIPALDQIEEISFAPSVMMDIAGPSGSGKTELLLQLCAASTLPETFQELKIGGIGASIIFVCMGFTPREIMLRLLSLYDQHARKSWRGHLTRDSLESGSSGSVPTKEWIESVFLDIQARVHFIHCENSFQFLAMAQSVDSLVKNNRNVAGILIDGLSTFLVPSPSDQLILLFGRLVLFSRVCDLASCKSLCIGAKVHLTFWGFLQWYDRIDAGPNAENSSRCAAVHVCVCLFASRTMLAHLPDHTPVITRPTCAGSRTQPSRYFTGRRRSRSWLSTRLDGLRLQQLNGQRVREADAQPRVRLAASGASWPPVGSI